MKGDLNQSLCSLLIDEVNSATTSSKKDNVHSTWDYMGETIIPPEDKELVKKLPDLST